MAAATTNDIELGTARDRRKRHMKLYQAALKDDWHTAKAIYDEHPGEINAKISKRDDTALHIAVAANKSHFVKELIEYKKTASGESGNSTSYAVDLTIQNQSGNTAFCLAAASGEKEVAELMLKKNPRLAMTRGSNGMLPVYMAALLGHTEVVSYLYRTVEEELSESDRRKLFVTLVESDIYDVASTMLDKHEYLATARDKDILPPPAPVGETALHAFARKCRMPSKGLHEIPLGFQEKWLSPFSSYNREKEEILLHKQACKLVDNIWSEVVLMDDREISRLIGAPSRLIFTAAKQGNHDFLKILIQGYPDLVFKVDEKNHSIFHYAIKYRRHEIFKLIHEIGSVKSVITTYKDDNKNNMLHLAAMVPPQSHLNVVPGAALQLQYELLWFEEVKKVVPPRHFEEENNDGKSPGTLFVEQHEKLRKGGEKWMLNTANSCVIVAILVTTVVFAAAFTVPGGYKGQEGNTQPNGPIGMPIFLHRLAFKLFAIWDAVSLIFSTISVLTFLSILTSRYAIDDFLSSLPNKLIIGLFSLFISILAMMICFMSAFFVIFNHELLLIAIPVAAVAGLPVVVFAWQQRHLFIDVFKATYMAKSVFKANKQPLFS